MFSNSDKIFEVMSKSAFLNWDSSSEPQNRDVNYFLNFPKDRTQLVPFPVHRREVNSLHTVDILGLWHGGLVLLPNLTEKRWFTK